MPDSPTDLAGLRVLAEDFLAAVLETAAQPIWVVDPEGVIRFANPAAIAALGYDSAGELFGRDSHETIHYRRPDGTPYPAAECPMLRPRAAGETVRSDLDWFFRRDGSMFPVSYVSAPIEMPEGRGAVVAFTDIEDRLRAERLLREHDAVLAAREGALRRIAALVARGAASPDVFAAIAREVAQVLGMALVVIWRHEPGRPATVVGAWGDRPHPFQAGTTWPVEEATAAALLPDVDRPARIEDFGGIGGVIPDAIAETGIRSGTGAAIVVDGELWGVMGAGVAESDGLLDHIEDRLAEFTELVATTIANSTSREQLARLADEQAALRRVATLVAHASPPDKVFAAVAEELGRLLGLEGLSMIRYDPGEIATIVANSGAPGDTFVVGTQVPLGGENVTTRVFRTGRAARIDDYADATGSISELVRAAGGRAAVGTTIIVSGRLWGVMAAASQQAERMPDDTEPRMARFTELVASAIANVEARADLAASRARLVAAADDERRRVVRDLHDGAQQRLVHTVITLQQAHGRPDVPDGVRELVDEGLAHARSAITELRELVRGIHPAILSRQGLAEAVETLADRFSLPVEVEIARERYPPAVELAAYFVVAEALTNVAKHAGASRATVTAVVEGSALVVQIADDGAGGADPGGNGIIGLADRLAALNGTLGVESPKGAGTRITATIPVGPTGG